MDNEEKNEREETVQIEEEQEKEIEKKDIEEMLEELQKRFEENNQNVKIIKVKPVTKKQRVLGELLKYMISFITLVAVNGYIPCLEFDYFYYLLIYASVMPAIEFLIDYFIEKCFFKAILYSFGSILLIAPLMSFYVSILILPFISIANIGLSILAVIIYIVIKKLFLMFINNIKENNRKIKVK